MVKYFSVVVFFCTLPSYVSAQTPDSKAGSQTPISVGGVVDVYFSKNFNSPANQMNQLRNFNIYNNQIGLNLAKVTVQKEAEPVGFRLDLAFGTGNDIVQGLVNPLTGATTLMTSTLDLVEQAYLTVVAPIGSGLTIDVGKFATLMGYEVIETDGNWNYSRSLLFAWAIPYYHTGIRLTYPLTGNFTASLHIVNGWNSVIDNNKSKSIGLGLNYSPTSGTEITLNGMTGFEQPAGVPYGKKDVGEIIVTQRLGENLSLAADATYGRERVAGVLEMWKGIAVYAKYNLSSESDVALRGEGYYDPQGYTTGATFPKPTYKEITATYEYRPWSPLILRLEARDDFANGNEFISSDAALPTRDSQPTVLVGAIVQF